MSDRADERPWWAPEETRPPAGAADRLQAVAYYRHSAQDRQENSVAIQQEQVLQWATENGVDVIHEFADRGKSGLTAEGRDAFNDMMENWVRRRDDFQLVLCLDVSRWGRFQDFDLSATYSADCKRHGKQVVYTTLGKPKANDPLHQVYIQFERFRAAQYSRELSDKVFRGCVKVVQQGYWAGGSPPYGLERQLLDEQRRPVQVLQPGQRKGIQNQRVTLTPGEDERAGTVRRIFRDCAEGGLDPRAIAAALNRDGVAPPGGGRWASPKVRRILTNEEYAGTLVYNRTTQKLRTPSRHNPPDQWVKTADAFEPVVDRAVFDAAQRALAAAAARYEPAAMIERLGRLVREHAEVRPSLLRADPDSVSAGTYAKRFASLDAAYQRVFAEAVAGVRADVEAAVAGLVGGVERHDDFLVVNGKFTVAVQPSVPVPHGYSQYWYFLPDARATVDITLGVPVSGPDGPRVLGYLALPRLLVARRGIRLFDSSAARLDLYGHAGLDIIVQLARSSS